MATSRVSTITATGLLLLFFLCPGRAWAYVASSETYRLDSDVISVGGSTSSSATYSISDTVGEAATGTSTGSTYTLGAGYQQMIYAELEISVPGDLTLGDLETDSAGQIVNASTTLSVTSPGGYSLSVRADSSPAMLLDSATTVRASNRFRDYSQGAPTYNWFVNPGLAAFGFSPEGGDIHLVYKDNGSSCGVGSLDTVDKCWDGFGSSDQVVAASSSPVTNSETVLKLRAELSQFKNQDLGAYSADITVTVVSQ